MLSKTLLQILSGPVRYGSLLRVFPLEWKPGTAKSAKAKDAGAHVELCSYWKTWLFMVALNICIHVEHLTRDVFHLLRYLSIHTSGADNKATSMFILLHNTGFGVLAFSMVLYVFATRESWVELVNSVLQSDWSKFYGENDDDAGPTPSATATVDADARDKWSWARKLVPRHILGSLRRMTQLERVLAFFFVGSSIVSLLMALGMNGLIWMRVGFWYEVYGHENVFASWMAGFVLIYMLIVDIIFIDFVLMQYIVFLVFMRELVDKLTWTGPTTRATREKLQLMYRSLQVFNKAAVRHTSLPIAVLLFVSVDLQICGLFVIVKFYHKLNVLIIVSLAAELAAACGVTGILIHYAVGVREASTEYPASFRKNQKGLSLMDKAFFRSCYPIQFYAGSMIAFTTKDFFPSLMLSVVLENVVNLILSY